MVPRPGLAMSLHFVGTNNYSSGFLQVNAQGASFGRPAWLFGGQLAELRLWREARTGIQILPNTL